MSTLSVTLKNPADTTNAHFEFNLKIYKECTTKELISEVYPFFENTVSIRFRFNWSSNVKIYVQLKSLNGVTSILLLTGDDLIVENIQTDCYSWLLISDFYYNCNKLLVITQMSLHLNIPSRGRIQFKELYKDKEFTDFELFGEDNEVEAVPVHRNVLAVSSPVLKSMLLGDWKEAKQGHVQVSGVSIVTLQQFKEFIYLKQIPKEPLDYAKLYILASYYMLNDLTELENGVDLIRKNFNSKNVWDWLEYCVQQKNDKLLLMRLTYNNIDDLANDLFYPRETDSHYFFYLKKQKKTNSQDIKLSNNYKDLYDDVDFTDFELRLESEDAAVPVHRNVLAVNSPVLQKMFLEDWKDTKQGYVKIPNISIATTTIQQFKDYIYLKKVPNDASDCFKLFPFAAHFMMPELERDAAIKIANDLKPENVWDYFERLTVSVDSRCYDYVCFELNLKINGESSSTELISKVHPLFQNTTICFRVDWSSKYIKFFTQLKASNGGRSSFSLTDFNEGYESRLEKKTDMLRTDLHLWQLIGSRYYDTSKTQYYISCRVNRNRVPFRKLYDETKFTDFGLLGEDHNVEAVSVHRNVLAVSSPVLKSMLLGDWKEAKQGHVQIPGVSIVTLQQFKEFIYLKQIPKEPLDYAKLITLASYYMLNDLPELEREGARLIPQNFNSENVSDWFEYCVQQKNDKLLLMRLKNFTYGNIAALEEHFFKDTTKVNRELNNETTNEHCLYDDMDFTDFELRLESEDAAVPVHRNMLAVNSSVLQKMLLEDWKDTKQGYVKIPNISIATIQQFKDYIYLKKVPNDASDCFKLFPLAAHFMMPELERDAAIKIANDLKPENVWDYFEWCVQYKSNYLLLAVLRKILDEDKIGPLEEYFAKL